MKTRLIFISILLSSSISSYGQSKIPYHIELENILVRAKESVNVDGINEINHDSTISSKDFDFFTLNPSSSNRGESFGYYELFYNNNVLKKVSYSNSNNRFRSYSIYFFFEEDFTFGIASIPGDKSEETLVSGLFVRINSTGYSFYCGVRPGISFSEWLSEDITFMMLLDNKFSPSSKVNVYQNEPLTYSKFVLSDGELLEYLNVIPKTRSIFGYKSLANYTLFDIVDLLEGEGFMFEVSALVKPIYPIEGKPIWSYPYSKYLRE